MAKNYEEREFDENDLGFVLGGCNYAAQEYYLGKNAEAGSEVAREEHENLRTFFNETL